MGSRDWGEGAAGVRKAHGMPQRQGHSPPCVPGGGCGGGAGPGEGGAGLGQGHGRSRQKGTL